MPCVLHRAMIIALIALNKIFIEGYSNCAEEILNSDIGDLGAARFNKSAFDIENIVNTQILGQENNLF